MQRVASLNARIDRIFLMSIFLCGLMAGCRGHETEEFDPTPPTPSITSTLVPTPTPTPVVQKVVLLAPDGTSPSLAETIASTLQELVNSTEMEFEVTEQINTDEVGDGLRIVVALAPSQDLGEIAEKNPKVQFIAVGIPNLQASSNLSIIGPDGFRIDQQAFISGYIAAVITKDWRIGFISQLPSDVVQNIETSFDHGVIFYCGLCQLTYPPFYSYPINLHVAEQSSDEDWLTALDTLKSYSVTTIVLHSDELHPSVIEALNHQDATLIGNHSPPQELSGSWAVTVRFAAEEPLKDHWQETLSDQGGWIEDIPIRLEDINETIFSTGRQRWVMEILDDLNEGYIDTGVLTPSIDAP